MKQAKGFTLIELIVVIVVLGILAVTAIPKFMDVQKEARIATLQGVNGALNSANGIVYGQAAIQGIDKATDGTVKYDVVEKEDGTVTSFTPIKVAKGNIVADVSNINNAMDTDMNRYDLSPADADKLIDSEILVPVDSKDANGAVVFTFQNLGEPGLIEGKELTQKCHMFVFNDKDSKLRTQYVLKGC